MINKILRKLIEKIFNFMERNSLVDEKTNEMMKNYQKIKNLR